MARVRALLRRSRPERIAEKLSAGDLDLDRETRACAAACATCIWVRPNFACSNISWKSRGACFRARSFSTAYGAFGRDRRTHGRCACRALAQGLVARPRTRPDPNGARHRLFVRRDFRQGVSLEGDRPRRGGDGDFRRSVGSPRRGGRARAPCGGPARAGRPFAMVRAIGPRSRSLNAAIAELRRRRVAERPAAHRFLELDDRHAQRHGTTTSS